MFYLLLMWDSVSYLVRKKAAENVCYEVASKNELFADPNMDREVLRTIRKRVAALRNS